ncbi:MAG: chloride channel protein [Daejeonella sp.]
MSVIKEFSDLVTKKVSTGGNKLLKQNLLNALPFWLGAIITGIVAVIYAKLFALAETGTAYIWGHAPYLFFIITPVTFLIAWILVVKYAPFSRGSGIPQVNAAIEYANPKDNEKVDRLLSIRVIFVKILSSLVLVFGGGAIGREGPTIQIAGSIFKKINDLLPSWYPKVSKRNMIITGASAGLAAAFNTPLGGIVFAIEELTKTHISFFKSALLTGVIIAGLTALNFLGPYLYLGYPTLSNLSVWIFLPVILIALITGIGGSALGSIILYIFDKKAALTKDYQKVIYTILCGLILASAAFFIDPRIFGSGKEIMVSTLFTSEKQMEWYIPIFRMIGPILSFTTGAAGGIFAPSLGAGASMGAVLSGWLELSASDTNIVILCGMVGFLTGITRSPFTSSILVLEMTNSHNIIFYLMLTGLLANIISNLIDRHSFYDKLKHKYMHEISLEEKAKA